MATEPRRPKVSSENFESGKNGNLPRNTEQLDPARREIIFWEERNPRCVFNLLPDSVKKHARQLPPELLGASERELRFKYDYGHIDEHLRISFWDEYFSSCDHDKSMRMSAVYARVCDRDHFYEICTNPLRLAFILKPPMEYIYQMRSILNMGLHRFEEVLKLPLVKESGVVDTKLISEIIKIVSIVDNRVKGAVTQKFQIDATQKNLHVHAQANYEPPKSHQDVERELREIEKEIKQLGSANLNIFEQGQDDGNTIEVAAISTET